MKTFWKFIVFTGLLIQFTFAYSANHDAVFRFQKENNTKFVKESFTTYHFIQPRIERGIPDLKHNPIPVGLNSNTLLPLFLSLKENNIKIVLSNQDINRCEEVSILLFPFHYFW